MPQIENRSLTASSSDPEMSSLACLWLARALPLPLNSGDKTYTARLAQALAAAGAAVTLMGLADPTAPPPRPLEAFDSRIEWRIVPGRPRPSIVALASPLPLVAARFGTRQYARDLNTILRAQDFDAVIFDQYAMAWAIESVHQSKKHGRRPLIVYIAHNFETEVTTDIARNFRGNLARKAALKANARKTANAERNLVRAADIIVTLTAEDAESLARLSPRSTRLVLQPGYDGPRISQRRIVQATPRRVAMVGSYRWTPKQMNMSAFLEAADPILHNAGIGLDVVGEIPVRLRNAWEARVKATRFHGFVEHLDAFLAARRLGLVVEETGGGFKLKTLDYIFNRLPVAAIRGSTAGLPLTPGRDYLSFASMRELGQGVAAVIDDIDRLNSLQQSAYEKCDTLFDWAVRGQTFYHALLEAVNRHRAIRVTRPVDKSRVAAC